MLIRCHFPAATDTNDGKQFRQLEIQKGCADMEAFHGYTDEGEMIRPELVLFRPDGCTSTP